MTIKEIRKEMRELKGLIHNHPLRVVLFLSVKLLFYKSLILSHLLTYYYTRLTDEKMEV